MIALRLKEEAPNKPRNKVDYAFSSPLSPNAILPGIDWNFLGRTGSPCYELGPV
jgi:hypothetical protein